MESKRMIKVNCSFCGKNMECPENMLAEVEKHMCSECFENADHKELPEDVSKIHIDVRKDKMFESLVNALVEDVFPEVWDDQKDKLKQMSKRELAEEMFSIGAFIAIDNLTQVIKSEAERESKTEKDNKEEIGKKI